MHRLVLLAVAAAGAASGVEMGGKLVVAQRSEPRTLNPLLAADEPSRSLAGLMHAGLVRVHGMTQQVEAGLAERWNVSPDGRKITVRLRQALRFCDGEVLDADDVLFTFAVIQDEKVGSPLRESLRVGGRPVEAAKVDDQTVQFTLAQPYALGERLFDGIPILPKHLLEPAYRGGTFASAWTNATSPARIAGAGPFCLREYIPGQRILLERNRYFYRRDAAGRAMPYLDEVAVLITPGDDAQVTRFLAGDADLIAGFGAGSYAVLSSSARRTAYDLHDAGAAWDYTFLLFNLNPGRGRPWFGSTRFRQAVSAVIDRDAIVRLAYRGRATAIWGYITPGRKAWVAADLPRPSRDLERARLLLRQDGFRWDRSGALLDGAGMRVRFTAIVNAANQAYTQTAAIVQQDLRQIGIGLHVVPLEFRALVERLMNRRDFDTALVAMRPGDSDPVADMNVLVSSGRTRLWNLSGKAHASWEAEIDSLMVQQIGTRDPLQRKALVDRVQRVLSEQMPVVCLAAPNVLIAARKGIANLKPAVSGSPALWNIEELYWTRSGRK